MRSKKEREKIKAREESSPPLLFIAFFTLHRSPLSERLEQATSYGEVITSDHCSVIGLNSLAKRDGTWLKLLTLK